MTYGAGGGIGAGGDAGLAQAESRRTETKKARIVIQRLIASAHPLAVERFMKPALCPSPLAQAMTNPDRAASVSTPGVRMADVFLSYKREDQEIARGVAADLETEGFSVFFDERIDVGDNWDERIERELAAAKACVVLWSPKSRDSQWVRREAREAMARRMLCPALIAKCKAPLEFSDVQTADLIGRRAGDRAHAEWRRLCDGVGKCVGRRARGIEAAANVAPAAPQTPPRAASKLNVTIPKLPRLQRVKRGAESNASTAPDASPSSSRRALVIGAATIGGAAAIGGGYYGWTRVRAEAVQRAWEEARAAGTRRAVNTFLREHPNAPQVIEAREALRSLPLTVRELTVLSGHQSEVYSPVFSLDDRYVVTGSHDLTARVWDAISGQEVAVLPGHAFAIHSVSFDSSGTRILTASGDARIWDAGSGRELARLNRSEVMNAAVFSPDSGRIATCASNGTARIWDSETLRETAMLGSHNDSVRSVAFSHDGMRVVTASWDRTARVFDAASGLELATLLGHEGWVESAKFDASGTRVVTASTDNTARLWNAASGEEIAVMRGERGRMNGAVFRSDGARILTAAEDKTARIWDATVGLEVAVLRGHERGVLSAVFSADGSRVATASADNTARVWDGVSGRQIAVLQGHENAVSGVAFSTGGQRIISASWDGTARIWEIDEET
jgi:WD40 repeat protein